MVLKPLVAARVRVVPECILIVAERVVECKVGDVLKVAMISGSFRFWLITDYSVWLWLGSTSWGRGLRVR